MESETIDIVVNGEARPLERGATVSTLVASLGLRPELVAVEVNRDLVPRARHAERELESGDRIEIVTLVGGG